MRELIRPPSEARQRLLDVAELLFAERGFDAVSVRDITHQAKANVAAINYHFGTREGLLGLVVTRCLTPINEERVARLGILERKWAGKLLPVEEIVDAFVRPLVGKVRQSKLSERLFCTLLGRIFALSGEGSLTGAAGVPGRGLNARFNRALRKALPTVLPEEVGWRSHFMVGALIHMLMNQDPLQRLSDGEEPSMEATLSRFIRFASAGLREGMELEVVVNKGPQATFDF